MKRLKAMTNREWVQRHKPDFIDEKLIVKSEICPCAFGLDNDCSRVRFCIVCWNLLAKRNGKYIMKVVRE